MSNVVDRLRGVKSSLAIKVPCRVATAGNVSLSGEQTIAGVTTVDGDRVLVRLQSTASENGIYKVSTGAWRREPDWDGQGDVVTGTRVYVTAGSTGRGAYVVTTSGAITIGTTAVAIEGDSVITPAGWSGLDTLDLVDDETDKFLIKDYSDGNEAKEVLGKNLGFTPSGTGARLRPLQEKVREKVSVADFRLVIDADDTASFTRAIASRSAFYGGHVYVPPGTYHLAPFTIDRPITLYGDGPGSVNLVCNHATADWITITSSRSHISGVSLDSSVTRTAGYYVNCTNIVRCSFSNLYVTKHFIGWLIHSNAIMDFDRIEFRDGEAGAGSGCVIVDGDFGNSSVEISFYRVIADKASGTQQDFGIKLINSDATHIVSCDIIRSGRDLFINPGAGDIVSSTYVVDSYFDTSNQPGILIALGHSTGCVQFTHFIGTWTGAHTGTAGVYIDNTAAGICDGFDFIGHTSYGNAQGYFVVGPVEGLRVGKGAVTGNTSHGFAIGAGVLSFEIEGVTVGPTDNQAGNGAYAIEIESGFAGVGKIRNCTLDNNFLGDIDANGAILELWGNSPSTIVSYTPNSHRYGESAIVGWAGRAALRSLADGTMDAVNNAVTDYAEFNAKFKMQGAAPANASDTGSAGNIRYDSNYVYVCVATNTWKRADLTTW